MSKVKILAIEDDPIIAETLSVTVNSMGYQLVDVADNGADALAIHGAVKPDLVLMDIMLNGRLNGIEVAEKMNDLRPTPIIFITSLRDQSTFEKAKSVIPYAYITKPLDEVNLQYAIELAISRIDQKDRYKWEDDVLHDGCFFIKDRNLLTKVNLNEIILVQVEGKNINIVTTEREIAVRFALKDLERRLPSGDFLRVHRNYLINKSRLKSIDLENGVLYVDDKQVPIGMTYRDHVLRQFHYLG